MEHVLNPPPRASPILAITLIAGVVVFAALAIEKARLRGRLKMHEAKLDEAIEATMDCSDPIAQY